MKNALAGKWHIAGREGVVWEFTEFSKSLYASGVEIHKGLLREWSGEHLVDLMEYNYDPTENELIVDRSGITSDSRVWDCIEEHFLVEAVDNHTLKLCALDDIES